MLIYNARCTHAHITHTQARNYAYTHRHTHTHTFKRTRTQTHTHTHTHNTFKRTRRQCKARCCRKQQQGSGAARHGQQGQHCCYLRAYTSQPRQQHHRLPSRRPGRRLAGPAKPRSAPGVQCILFRACAEHGSWWDGMFVSSGGCAKRDSWCVSSCACTSRCFTRGSYAGSRDGGRSTPTPQPRRAERESASNRGTRTDQHSRAACRNEPHRGSRT